MNTVECEVCDEGEESEDRAEHEIVEEVEEEYNGLSQDGLWVTLRRMRRDWLKRRHRGQQWQGQAEGEENVGRAVMTNGIVYECLQDEVNQRERVHCPIKPWSSHCLGGRASNAKHKRTRTKTKQKRLIFQKYQWTTSS